MPKLAKQAFVIFTAQLRPRWSLVFYHNSPMSFLFNLHAKLHIRLAECSNIHIFCGVWCMLISTHSHSCAPLCIMCSKAKHSGDNLLSSLPTHSSILLTEAAQWATVLLLVRTQEKKSLSQQESNYTYANILPVSRITRKKYNKNHVFIDLCSMT